MPELDSCFTIMMVDDTPTNLRILDGILRRDDYDIRGFLSGDAFLEAVSRKTPDLVLLDTVMPDMDGFDVYEKMMENDRLSRIPVIFISTAAEQTNRLKAFAMGGVDYITKPFQQEEVRARINVHVRVRQLEKQVEKNSKAK